VSIETLEQLGLPRGYNMLSFTVNSGAQDIRHVQQTAAAIRDMAAANGVPVYATQIPDPTKHWAYDIVTSMIAILQRLGVLALLLGACLVVNTMWAIITSQMRQIGVMQMLGATPGDLIRLYMGMVLLFSLLAAAIGIPLGLAGSRLVTSHSVALLNFDSGGYARLPSSSRFNWRSASPSPPFWRSSPSCPARASQSARRSAAERREPPSAAAGSIARSSGSAGCPGRCYCRCATRSAARDGSR
jgi:hypothetical protein